MHIRKGEIYLANLGNRDEFDIGKVRPVLIYQNNMLNRMVERTAFSDVVILPLSSQIRDNDFTFFLKSTDKLEKDSVVLCNAIKMIHADRLLVDKGLLTKLSSEQIENIDRILYHLFDCKL
ncbi:MAG: type II toxin-antitoxin system PemK/MazF family toxin [Epsilonproteobacteria bacterium]|nr:type II toxin-antitoxin system PemK/MazF family toxin [Campylobacterota bacterium]